MKKSIKAIIAAISASIMCAAPIATTITDVTPATGITAEASSDIIYDASYLNSNYGTIVITSDSLTYRIVGNHATLHGRYNPVSNINMPDKIRYNGTIYPITEVEARAFQNACKTACGEGVYNFRSGKYVTKIGDYAFNESSLGTVDLNDGLEEIGYKAFSYTNIGTSLYIPGSVTNIRGQAFKGCTKIKYVTVDGGISLNPAIPDPNLTPISFGSQAFYGLSSLRSFTLYRRYPLANYSHNPDHSVFGNCNPSFNPDNHVLGNVYGVPEFIRLFFHD